MHLHVQSTVKAGHHTIRGIQWVPQANTNGDTGWLAVNSTTGTAGVTRTSLRMNAPKSYNLHSQQPKDEVDHLRWNDARQVLVTCDQHGNICQWMQKRSNWIAGSRCKLGYPFAAAANSSSSRARIVDVICSHSGRLLVVCYSNGVLSVLEEGGEERRSYALLNPMPGHVFTCFAFDPSDARILMGTAEGSLFTVDFGDHDPVIQETDQLNRVSALHALAWSCPAFDTPDARRLRERGAPFVLAVSLQNGLLLFLKSHEDRLPVVVNTGLSNVLLQWNAGGELLAVIGQQTRYRPNSVLLTEYLDPYLYSNVLSLYNKKGHKLVSACLKKESYLVEFQIARCLHWAHRDSCVFVAAGTHVYTVKVIRSASKTEVPSLQHISCSKVCSMIRTRKHTEHLVLPPSIHTQIGCMLKSIIDHPIPESEHRGQEFLYLPLKKHQLVHCTLKKRNDSLFILYLEFLGNLIPLLGAKQRNGIKSQFVLFDARKNPWLPQKSEDFTISPFTRRASRRNNLFSQCRRNTRVQDMSDTSSNWVNLQPSNILGTVNANIWKTKFRIKHKATHSSALSATVHYKPSILHMAPRKINIQLQHIKRKKILTEANVPSSIFCNECSSGKRILMVEIHGKAIKVRFSQKTTPVAFFFDFRETITVDMPCEPWKIVDQKPTKQEFSNYLHDWTWIIQTNQTTLGKSRSKFLDNFTMLNMPKKFHSSMKMHVLVSYNTAGESESNHIFVEEAFDVGMFYNKIQINKKMKLYDIHKGNNRNLLFHTTSNRTKTNFFRKKISQSTKVHEFNKQWEEFSSLIAQIVQSEKRNEVSDKRSLGETSFQMRNKAPLWNKTQNIYQLDCGGRVTVESEKNCQFEYKGEQVFQFGRIGTTTFTLDFKYPFTPIDAFAVALTSLTHGMK